MTDSGIQPVNISTKLQFFQLYTCMMVTHYIDNLNLGESKHCRRCVKEILPESL